MNYPDKLIETKLKLIFSYGLLLIIVAQLFFNPTRASAQARCCPSSHPYLAPHPECPFLAMDNLDCCTDVDDSTVPSIDCASLVSPQPTGLPQPTPGQMNPTDPLTVDKLKSINPLIVFQGNQDLINDSGSLSVSGLINRALSFIFPLAGLLLFLMLVWGGFEMLTGAASKKNMDAGKERIMAAIIGFLLLFASYWIVQIVEYITGVQILG